MRLETPPAARLTRHVSKASDVLPLLLQVADLFLIVLHSQLLKPVPMQVQVQAQRSENEGKVDHGSTFQFKFSVSTHFSSITVSRFLRSVRSSRQ